MYIRKCPTCPDDIKYNVKTNFNKSEKNNKTCKKCSLKRYHEKNTILTKEKCKELALKCKTRNEFYKKYKSAYNKSLKNDWHEELCEHMIKIGNYYNRCIYVYEFDDNYAYVGLTYNLEKRKNKHLIDKKSHVYKHIKNTNSNFITKQVTDYLNKDEASLLEEKIIQEYKKTGWYILNKQKGGGLGGNIIKWDKEECIKLGLKCKTRNEFIKKSQGAYLSAKRNGWLEDIYKNMIEIVKPKNYWTKEKCHEEALKYNNRTIFREKSISAYGISIRNSWLNEICNHMTSKRIPKGYWTYEKCKEMSLHIEKRTHFRNKYPGAYKACKKNNWLNDFFED